MFTRNLKKIFSNYTNVIITLLLVTTFSGALRKWAGFPSIANNIFLLVMMLIPLYLLFFFKNTQTKPLNSTLRSILQVFCFILIILAIHPLNLTYFHGIFGILVHLIFIAIILSYFKNIEAFNETKVIKLFFIVLASQLVIATIQSASPSDSAINRYADNRQEAPEEITDEEDFVQASATVGDATRVTGTFSYLGGYTAVLFFFLLFTFYLSKAKKPSYLLFLLPTIVYGALLSGSRGAVAFTIILSTAFIITERKLLLKNPRPIFNTSAIIGLILMINLAIGDKLGFIEKTTIAYDNFMLRVEGSAEESEGRLTGDLLQVFTRDFDYRYTGVGLGSTYQGANALFGTSTIIQNTPMEGELFRILVEGGIFLVLFRWFFIIIIFSYLDIPTLLKIILFLFFCVFAQNVFNIYNAVYFATGLIILNQAYRKDKVFLANESI